jgi:glutamine synthetase
MVKKTASAGDSKAAAIAKVFDLIQEHSVELVDLRFTDTHGKWQHTCQHVSTIEEDSFTDGFMFDGSSIAGWKAINESDMVLLPDPTSAVMDPFSARPQLDPVLRYYRAVHRPAL